jgi:hypothetical protein
VWCLPCHCHRLSSPFWSLQQPACCLKHKARNVTRFEFCSTLHSQTHYTDTSGPVVRYEANNMVTQIKKKKEALNYSKWQHCCDRMVSSILSCLSFKLHSWMNAWIHICNTHASTQCCMLVSLAIQCNIYRHIMYTKLQIQTHIRKKTKKNSDTQKKQKEE